MQNHTINQIRNADNARAVRRGYGAIEPVREQANTTIEPTASLATTASTVEFRQELRALPSTGYVLRVMEGIERAFKSLRSERIIGRASWQCCNSCGYRAMEAEAKRRLRGRAAGFVFYHEQDESDLFRAGYVRLTYGHLTDDSDAASLSIAESVVVALRRESDLGRGSFAVVHVD